MSVWGYLLLLIALVVASGYLGRAIGVRQERGRQARWEEAQVSSLAPGGRGLRLRRIRLSR